MEIFIPYQTQAIGGPMSFVRLLANKLQQKGYGVRDTFSSTFDLLLVIASCPLIYVLYAKLRGKPVIQRLDGVYHPGIPGINGVFYWFKNWRVQVIHNWLADMVIYQSHFSQQSCTTFLGKRTGASVVISNGVVVPENNHHQAVHTPIRLVAYANWRRRDQIEPLLQAFKHLPEGYELTLFGPYTTSLASIWETITKHPRIHYQDSKKHTELMETIRAYDIFLFADQSACPNSVLEAFAAGLPVVAYNRGAIPELVNDGQNGRVVALPPHKPYKDSYPFNEISYQQFAHAVRQVAADYPHFTQQAVASAQNQFDLDQIVIHYLDILHKV